MKLLTVSKTVLLSSALILSSTAFAAAETSAGAGISTLGLGVFATYNITDSFVLRGQANHFNYDTDFTESEIKYDGDLKLSSIGAIGDWYPMDSSGFRLSAGAYYNGNKIEAEGKPKSGSNEFIIGGEKYTLDTMNGDIDFASVAPYLGVGWSSGNGRKAGLSFNADLGVLYQGSPEVSFKATGTGTTRPDFNESLQVEEDKLEDELKNYKWYPVLSFSTAYRF